MSGPLHIPVATITRVVPHPNADNLAIAQVLGWQCVVERGQFKAGDKVVYFAPDTMLPRELSDCWNVTRYLEKQRIKPTRLRGEPSFGLVIPCENDAWQVGENVAEHYGVSKWQPPTREHYRQSRFIPNPDHLPSDPFFPDYTHIQNLRHHPTILGDLEAVVVTEKLHGTNSRIGMVNGQWMAGSHRVRRGQGDTLYWSPRVHAERLVEDLAQHHRQVVLYGEILGDAVQSLDYGYKDRLGYRAFDLMIDGRYVDYDTFEMCCWRYHIPMVPLCFSGLFDFSTVRQFAQGATTLDASHLREGVVVKPMIERTDPRIGRVILKYVSDDYLLSAQSDFAEV